MHVLLNSDFFAPGQAYTALSRARRIGQLHLWGFDLDAVKADPEVAREYARLRRRPLDAAAITRAPPYVKAPLPALGAMDIHFPPSFETYGVDASGAACMPCEDE